MTASVFIVGAGSVRAQTGLVYSGAYLKHDTGEKHPERKERLETLTNRLKADGVWEKLVVIEPSPASVETLSLVHSSEYIAEAARACRDGAPFLHSKDTPVSKDSFETARLAAGGALTAADAVMAGKVKNTFCAVRPPGHHALKNKAMGFCLFNNIAVTARYLQKKYNLKKILVVDFDVHHGNGTEEIFREDPGVLYFSVHRAPFYPGTGGEKGKRPGAFSEGMPKGSGDKDYLKVFGKIFSPAAMEFKPDFVLVSAGFDAAEGDPLGGMAVTPDGYAGITRIIMDAAEKCCRGRLVSVLEGGYGAESLPKSAEAHILALMGGK
jgi:acetoin utilization deacetylase AcuC-like enzyme